jgi:hypothetical protein
MKERTITVCRQLQVQHIAMGRAPTAILGDRIACFTSRGAPEKRELDQQEVTNAGFAAVAAAAVAACVRFLRD